MKDFIDRFTYGFHLQLTGELFGKLEADFRSQRIQLGDSYVPW